jgi:hypothetical protein
MFDTAPDSRNSIEAKLLYNVWQELKAMNANFKMVGWNPTFGSCEVPKDEPPMEHPMDNPVEAPKGYYCKICKIDHATPGERIKCGMKKKG